MSICDFCLRLQSDGKCGYGLSVPLRMRCQEFDPGINKFCADPKDFSGSRQIIQMATYFDFKGKELQKIKRIAAREEDVRAELPVKAVD